MRVVGKKIELLEGDSGKLGETSDLTRNFYFVLENRVGVLEVDFVDLKLELEEKFEDTDLDEFSRLIVPCCLISSDCSKYPILDQQSG